MYSTPLAYLITFTCYGTWLHGDDRGSVDYTHRQYNKEFIAPNQVFKALRQSQMSDDLVILNSHERDLVEKTIREVCQYRQWQLHTISARSNHVHVVVTGNNDPDKIMGDFKAYATRKLRESNPGRKGHNTWTEGGSTRYLWNEASLVAACEYVQNQ